MALILGVDPGRTGALAVLDTHDGRVTCHDMPDTIEGLHALVCEMPAVRLAVLEQLHAGPTMPGTRVAAMFEHYGALKGALIWRDIPIRTVRPDQWKAAMGVPKRAGKTERKRASREKAGEAFPADAEQWRLAKHDGRAEAALLALYGKRWV